MLSFKKYMINEREDMKHVHKILKFWNKLIKYIKNHYVSEDLKWLDDEKGFALDMGLIDSEYTNYTIYFILDFGENMNGYYSYDNKDLVIFLHESDIKLKNIIDKIPYKTLDFFNFFVKYFEKIIYYDTFAHEFTHLIDDIKHSFKKITNTSELNDSEYFNDYVEINAFISQELFYYRNKIKQYKTFKEFKDIFTRDITTFWENLNPSNKKRVLKRLYDFWVKHKI